MGFNIPFFHNLYRVFALYKLLVVQYYFRVKGSFTLNNYYKQVSYYNSLGPPVLAKYLMNIQKEVV
jgi:hypothetical protein